MASNNDAASQLVDRKIQEKKVMMFAKSTCPFCAKAKQTLSTYNLSPQNYEALDMDTMGDDDKMNAMKVHLKELTGAASVPRVFIGGKFVGGGDDIVALEKDGKLKDLLQNVGALAE